jgi:ATP-dependent DNA ligase
MTPIFPTFPARPVNGGELSLAGPKVGRHAIEPKDNGWRALTHIETGTMFNRHGKLLTIAAEFAKALAALRSTLDCEAFKWADCEALERRHGIGRGTLIVLDVIPEPDYGTKSLVPYSERRRWLDAVLPVQDIHTRPEPDSVYLIPSFSMSLGHDSKTIWDELQQINRDWGTTGLNEFYEGIVMKREDSVYPIQLRSAEYETPYWMKHRWPTK